MSLTLKQVEEIAGLARLDLSKQEKERFRDQLSAILDYAEMLQHLDTGNVPPTAQVTGLVGVLREDVIAASLDQKEALANAPATQDGFVVVPTVLEES
ncbi:MAG: Asp-tRNA(Asn)/Glu-tRNA(Gln) amidotransferase subunit GatC [Ardenticatenales bacterium]|nr:Asp-tRNA(Asn)/Glu-tRNA(Gln) amidotransferase subunit GatC [Ardenticatenales bacterium]